MYLSAVKRPRFMNLYACFLKKQILDEFVWDRLVGISSSKVLIFIDCYQKLNLNTQLDPRLKVLDVIYASLTCLDRCTIQADPKIIKLWTHMSQ